MATARIEYLGDLRTKCTHLGSGVEIITDAPLDNKGRGEAFSPTDMVASAAVSCMLTIIGIYCMERDIPFTSATAHVHKIMESSPRRIGTLSVEVDFSGNHWTDDEQKRILAAAKACPVMKSLHESIAINYTFSGI
jgi:uncharacterized OsmC-like protein